MKRGAFTLEGLITSARGFGLETASPVQRALYRIVEGRPLAELAEHPDVVAMIGGLEAVRTLPSERPSEVSGYLPIRTYKSGFVAGAAIWLSQTVDLSPLKAGDPAPRIPIVAPREDLARATFGHLIGNLMAKPDLRRLVVGEPLSDSVMVRHPSGRAVEICVTPASAAGTTLVARWLLGAIFDESPRIPSEDDGGAITIESMVSAVRGRILPGGVILKVGTPVVAAGLAYKEVLEYFGKPSRDLVVLRSTGPAANPAWWTPARCEELRRRDERAYRRDVLADFLEATSATFDPVTIGRVFRAQPAGVMKGEPILVLDPSSLVGGDEFTWGMIRWAWTPAARDDANAKQADRQLAPYGWSTETRGFVRREIEQRSSGIVLELERSDVRAHDASTATLVIEEIGGVGGKFDASTSSRVFDAIAACARRWGCRRAVSDQRDSLAVAAELHRRDIAVTVIPWTNETKRAGVALVRRWLSTERLIAPTHDKLAAQLLNFKTTMTSTGLETYAARASGHDDYVAILLTAANAEAAGAIPSSPMNLAPMRGIVRHWPAM